MKTIITLLVISLLGYSTTTLSQNNQKQDNPEQVTEKKKNGPEAEFDKTVCDLGELVQNHPGTAVYTVTNKGNEPLIFSSVTASCGCTNLTWSQEPILPRKSTTISVTYNAAAMGTFMKTVTVRTNASDQPIVLQVKGKVIEK